MARNRCSISGRTLSVRYRTSANEKAPRETGQLSLMAASREVSSNLEPTGLWQRHLRRLPLLREPQSTACKVLLFSMRRKASIGDASVSFFASAINKAATPASRAPAEFDKRRVWWSVAAPKATRRSQAEVVG
jgi:hypothetical protein